MIVPRSASPPPRHHAFLSAGPLARLKVLIVLGAAILGSVTPASANEAQWRLCMAARELGQASARAYLFGEVFDTNIPAEQFTAILAHMGAAAIHITAAEALLGEPYSSLRARNGTAGKVLGLIDTYVANFGTMSARNRVFYIEQIFSVYWQGFQSTYLSSRPDAFQFNSTCDTKILRACFFFGKATIAAASVGTPGRLPFVQVYQGGANAHFSQAIEDGLDIAMDLGLHRPFNGHAKKICCTFGLPEDWAAKPDFSWTSPLAEYTAFEPIMLGIIAAAVLLDPVCMGPSVEADDGETCASSTAGTSVTGNLTVTDIRVYEAPAGDEPKTYGEVFEKAQARYIGWDMRFAHPPPGRHVDFGIDYRIYSSDGLFGQGTLNSYLEPDSRTSRHTTSWGWAQPGNWPVGWYRFELSITGKNIGSGTFQIIDSGGVVLPPPPPPPPPVPADCPATAPSPNWVLETGPGPVTRWYSIAGSGPYCGYQYGGNNLIQYRLEPSGNGYYYYLIRPDGSFTRSMRFDRGPQPDASTGWAEAGPTLALQPDGTWREIGWWFGRVR